MKNEILTQLRRVVEAAPDDKLHMRTFSEVADCGTAYCAAGWCVLDPWFQQNTTILEVFDIQERTLDDGTIFFDLSSKAGDRYRSLDVRLGNVYGISEEDAAKLFALYANCYDPAHAIKKEEVLANIDRLLAGKSAEPYDSLRERHERRKKPDPLTYTGT